MLYTNQLSILRLLIAFDRVNYRTFIKYRTFIFIFPSPAGAAAAADDDDVGADDLLPAVYIVWWRDWFTCVRIQVIYYLLTASLFRAMTSRWMRAHWRESQITSRRVNSATPSYCQVKVFRVLQCLVLCPSHTELEICLKAWLSMRTRTMRELKPTSNLIRPCLVKMLWYTHKIP